MCKIGYLIMLILLVICSVSDWKKRTIPVFLLVILGMVAVLFAFLCADVGIKLRIGGVLMGIAFLIVSRFTKEAIGYGDSWLVLFLGMQLGYIQAISLLFVSSMLAAVASLFLLWRHKWKRNATLPFVPFLTISYFAVVVV